MSIARLISLLLLLPVFSAAQNNAVTPSYPQDYFRNPLDIPIFLAGNFGECRPGHFHSGVDIKTLGKEGQPVHAAADGYISRIKMEKGGFGHGIYITHPNGYTTLYAHLGDFAPALQKYLKKEQYEKKHWDVDIALPADKFPVKKGQQIAWSGNTGASTAPHLHFEIRNTKTEHPLNPELFGLPVVDKIAPVPAEVVFYDGSIYQEGALTVSLVKEGGVYKAVNKGHKSLLVNNDTVQVPVGMVGIGINVDDYMDGSDNTIAFYTAKLYMDDSSQAQITLDNIGYDETRYINAYADYKTREQQHKWVQCLFKLPGNHLDAIYSNMNNNGGRLNLSENNKVHKIKIVLTDDKGNISTVLFYAMAGLYSEYSPNEGCIPFYANKPNSLKEDSVTFQLDDHQLYEDVCFEFRPANYPQTYHSKAQSEALQNPGGYSGKYQLHYPYVPVHHYFELNIRSRYIPNDLHNKVVMMYSDGKDEDGRAATFEDNGWCKARVRNFGTYWLDIDTTGPEIISMQKNGANLGRAKQIAFDAKDDMTSVRSFAGFIDGKWVCFEQHSNSFFYKFDEHCPMGKHEVLFKAEDENGNVSTVHLKFTR